MRTGWLLLALCACDAVFGLRETRRIPQDARETCPAIGTPPAFGPTYYQLLAQTCVEFSPNPSSDYALATCQGQFARELFGGPMDGTLAQITVVGAMSCTRFEQPHLYPEGNRALVATNNADCGTQNEYVEITKVDATTWQLGAPLTFAQPALAVLGAPSAGPHRHILEGTSAPPLLHELVDQEDGTWLEVSQYTPGDFAADLLGVAGPAALTPDGLRVVFRGAYDPFHGAVFYTDRPSIDARLGPATPLDNVPEVFDPSLAVNCSRLYFSGVQRVFYMEQQ